MPTRNRVCESGKTNKCYQSLTAFMEAAFLIQPWIATRTITDYCRLCYRARDATGFLECKRAQLAGYNTLLASLTMETTPQFGDTLKLLEDAKETCLSTRNPNETCHEKMQNTLQHTQQIYDQMLEDYKTRYATISKKPSPTPPM
jgi:hypothetical protein